MTATAPLVVASILSAARVFARRRYGRPPRRPPIPPPPHARDITLTTAEGKALKGWLLAAPGTCERSSAAVVLHGWGGSAADMLPVARPLRHLGLHVLVVDARCHGRSDDATFTSMPAFAEDLDVAVRWLRNQPEVDPDRIVLVGHSVGAGACLLVASRDPSVAGVLTLASMAHPREFMASPIRRRLPQPATWLALRLIEREIGHRFDQFAPVNTIHKVTAPVLIIHGAQDATVPVRDAYQLRGRARGPSRLLVLPDAHHYSVDALDQALPEVQRWLDEAGVLPTTPSSRPSATSTATSSSQPRRARRQQ